MSPSEIRQAVRDAVSGFANMVTRGKLSRAYYSADGQRIMLQGTHFADEEHLDVELLDPFGRTSVPAAGADYLVLQVNGSRDHKVALACDNPPNRIAGLGGGEFGDKGSDGTQIVYGATGLVITSPTNALTFKVGGATFTFDSSGNFKASGDVVAGEGGSDQVSLQNHLTPTAPSGPMAPPQPGS